MSPLTTVSNKPIGNIFIPVTKQTLVQCVCVCVYVLGAKRNPCARNLSMVPIVAETVARPFWAPHVTEPIAVLLLY